MVYDLYDGIYIRRRFQRRTGCYAHAFQASINRLFKVLPRSLRTKERNKAWYELCLPQYISKPPCFRSKEFC
jgi:hypothetical protein